MFIDVPFYPTYLVFGRFDGELYLIYYLPINDAWSVEIMKRSLLMYVLKET